MNFTGMDYSIYPYKIVELPEVEWEGLAFTLHFKSPLDKIAQSQIETTVNNWYTQGETGEEGSFHFMDTPTWSNKQTLSWWVDMGMTETTALALLLSGLSRYQNLIDKLELGRHSKITKSKYLYQEQDRSYLGLEYSQYPFKITELMTYDRDYAFTTYFSSPVNLEERFRVETTIKLWYKNTKAASIQKDHWIGDFEWRDQQTVAWWMSNETTRSGRLPLLLDLFRLNVSIDELIIGGNHLFPDRSKIKRVV